MTEPINSSSPIKPILPVRPTSAPGPAAAAGKDFKSILLDNLNEVNRLQGDADKKVQQLVTGETDDVAGVLLAANKAGIAFDLLMEVRNKLTDAYQQIQQMRI